MKPLQAGLILVCCALRLAQADEGPTHTIHLPTSKALTIPVPGFIARTNSFPATLVVSPDGRYAALLNQGFGTEESGIRQSIGILDLANNQLSDFPDDRVGDHKKPSYFVGLAFSSDGAHLYAAMSSVTESGIAVYRFADGRVIPERFIVISPEPLASGRTLTYEMGRNVPGGAPAYPAGLIVLPAQGDDRLLVADNLADRVLLIDSASGQVLRTFDVSVSRYVPTAYPYTVIANRAGTVAWVSLWNDSAVAELDLLKGTVVRRISLWRPLDPVAPGTHPTALLLSHDEKTLYVALANAGAVAADGVAAVSLKGKGLHCYCARLARERAAGATPLALALSPDERFLYVASASLDAVVVFATRPARVGGKERHVAPIGFIPTEWYPSALAVAGADLLIATAKGTGSGPNNMAPVIRAYLNPSEHPYIAARMGGSIQRLSLSEIQEQLPAYTRRVEEDNLIRRSPDTFRFAGGSNPIHHVIYILKENRTYDQILGDLRVGDGDPSLTMYGAEITPNEHRLALQFGVLDNFYDSGDVSANGHLWSDGSATSDYIEKIWPPIYRFSERPEDFGNALEQGVPDADDPGTGFLWDALARHHFSYRIYGEMLDTIWCRDKKPDPKDDGATSDVCRSNEIRTGEPLPPDLGHPAGGASPWPWPVPRLKSVRATKAAQRGHFDPRYPFFAIDYPDQLRVDEFLREFRGFVRALGTPHALPQFILLYLGNDHTGGTRPGLPTPQASVADNDLAVGRVVEAVSHSPYWEDTALFVVEDDAQDGADHVDAHRSIALVISKYAPRAEQPIVDHHFYTTAGMVHTIETLLGLPALNLFDSHAPLMTAPFTGPGTQPPYESDDSNLRSGRLYEVNDKSAPGARESSAMDFSGPDRADAQALNAVLWKDARARRDIDVSSGTSR